MPGVRAEIETQQVLDHNRRSYDALDARIRAVVGARQAVARHETGARWALRQSLVDLASVCELLAGELPRPRIPNRQAAAPGRRRAV